MSWKKLRRKGIRSIKNVSSAVNKASSNPLLRAAVSMAPGGAAALAAVDQANTISSALREAGHTVNSLAPSKLLSASKKVIDSDDYQGSISTTGTISPEITINGVRYERAGD